MSETKLKVLTDFGDGEKHINVSCDFTVYIPSQSLESIQADFEKLMMKYAI